MLLFEWNVEKDTFFFFVPNVILFSQRTAFYFVTCFIKHKNLTIYSTNIEGKLESCKDDAYDYCKNY